MNGPGVLVKFDIWDIIGKKNNNSRNYSELKLDANMRILVKLYHKNQYDVNTETIVDQNNGKDEDEDNDIDTDDEEKEIMDMNGKKRNDPLEKIKQIIIDLTSHLQFYSINASF
ncbi:hypothetical protein BDC45DRAFT_531160 [Circinella umbellata]|nr:hypothetical protein BDC45DRAFT_531160 [Circinella umbellata]